MTGRLGAEVLGICSQARLDSRGVGLRRREGRRRVPRRLESEVDLAGAVGGRLGALSGQDCDCQARIAIKRVR